MFDARLRKVIDPPLEALGRRLARSGVTANCITWSGFVIGCGAWALLALESYPAALALILLNRLADGPPRPPGAAAAATRKGAEAAVHCRGPPAKGHRPAARGPRAAPRAQWRHRQLYHLERLRHRLRRLGAAGAGELPGSAGAHPAEPPRRRPRWRGRPPCGTERPRRLSRHRAGFSLLFRRGVLLRRRPAGRRATGRLSHLQLRRHRRLLPRLQIGRAHVELQSLMRISY